MKKLFAYSLVTSSILFGGYSAKADWDYWGISDNGKSVNTINSQTGVGTKVFDATPYLTTQYDLFQILDAPTKDEVLLKHVKYSSDPVYYLFNNETKSLEETNTPWHQSYGNTGVIDEIKRPNIISDNAGNSQIQINGQKIIEYKNTDGSDQIGGDTDDIDIVSDGLNIDGTAVITKTLTDQFNLVLMVTILMLSQMV